MSVRSDLELHLDTLTDASRQPNHFKQRVFDAPDGPMVVASSDLLVLLDRSFAHAFAHPCIEKYAIIIRLLFLFVAWRTIQHDVAQAVGDDPTVFTELSKEGRDAYASWRQINDVMPDDKMGCRDLLLGKTLGDSIVIIRDRLLKWFQVDSKSGTAMRAFPFGAIENDSLPMAFLYTYSFMTRHVHMALPFALRVHKALAVLHRNRRRRPGAPAIGEGALYECLPYVTHLWDAEGLQKLCERPFGPFSPAIFGPLIDHMRVFMNGQIQQPSTGPLAMAGSPSHKFSQFLPHFIFRLVDIVRTGVPGPRYIIWPPEFVHLPTDNVGCIKRPGDLYAPLVGQLKDPSLARDLVFFVLIRSPVMFYFKFSFTLFQWLLSSYMDLARSGFQDQVNLNIAQGLDRYNQWSDAWVKLNTMFGWCSTMGIERIYQTTRPVGNIEVTTHALSAYQQLERRLVASAASASTKLRPVPAALTAPPSTPAIGQFTADYWKPDRLTLPIEATTISVTTPENVPPSSSLKSPSSSSQQLPSPPPTPRINPPSDVAVRPSVLQTVSSPVTRLIRSPSALSTLPSAVSSTAPSPSAAAVPPPPPPPQPTPVLPPLAVPSPISVLNVPSPVNDNFLDFSDLMDDENESRTESSSMSVEKVSATESSSSRKTGSTHDFDDFEDLMEDEGDALVLHVTPVVDMISPMRPPVAKAELFDIDMFDDLNDSDPVSSPSPARVKNTKRKVSPSDEELPASSPKRTKRSRKVQR